MISGRQDTRSLIRRMVAKRPAAGPGNRVTSHPSWGRHANRLQPRMRAGGARFHPVEIRAHVVPRQVQHLAPELPIFLDLCLCLGRSASHLAVCIAGRGDPPNGRFEGRVFKVEVNPELGAQVGMSIRDHVDPFDRRYLLDILQTLERFDRRATMMFSLAHGAYSVAWRAP